MNESAKKIIMVAVTVLAVLTIEAIAWQAGYISINIAGMPAAGGPPQAINIPVPDDMRALSGTVQEVGSSFVKFKLSATPFKMPGSSVRTVEIGSNTVIERLSQKDPAVFNKEMQDFAKKMQAGAAPAAGLTPPDPFKRVKISLEDIKVGDNVTASANENIIKSDKFTATTITVQETIQPPTLPTAPAPTQ